MRSWAAGLALAVALVSVALSGVAAATAASLFDTPPATGASAPPPPPRHGVLRQREVAARLDLLIRGDGTPALGVGDRVELYLFPDARLTMTVTGVTSSPGSGHAWTGTLDGVDLGSAVLAVSGGALAGRVATPGAVFRIGHAPDGRQVVEEIDEAALPPEAPPIIPHRPGAGVMPPDGEGPRAVADSAAQMDVMVVYTATARARAGGTAAMQAEVALAVASANQAYANNTLVQRLRLVFSGEVALTESHIDAELTALQKDALVGWLRDVTRADLVTLLVDHGPTRQFCGIGYLLNENSTAFAPFAFNVVERACASGNLSFAHELGHNMGAHHDLFVAPADATVLPYSHGWVDVPGRFRTVMAYPDQCASVQVTCTRIPFFSTPNQTQGDRPLGRADTSDNARTLAETAEHVANFRPALAPPLTLTTGVNQSAFAVGQTLVASVGLGNAGSVGGAVDVYVGILLPDGGAVFLTDLVITPAGGFALGSITNVGSYRPIATAVPLGAPFDASLPTLLTYQRTAADPAGGLALFLLVVTSGALADGVLDPAELLGASLAPFTFPG